MIIIAPSRQNFDAHHFFILDSNNGLVVNADGIGFYRVNQRALQWEPIFIDAEEKQRDRYPDESQNCREKGKHHQRQRSQPCVVMLHDHTQIPYGAALRQG